MHSALQTIEIVLEILSYLDSCTLISVAQTCSVLLGPAASLLWHTCKSLRPLIALLPEESCNYDEENKTYHLTKELSAADVVRVRYYGAFVKEVGLWRDHMSINAKDLGIVLAALGGDPLLPKVRKLDYEGPSPFAPYVLSIVGPCVDNLDLTYNINDTVPARDENASVEIGMILALKARRPDAVRTLAICSPGPILHNHIIQAMAGWHSLEAIELVGPSVDRCGLAVMAALPHLKSLQISFNMEAPEPYVSKPPRPSDALKKLHMMVWDSRAGRALAMLRPTSLVSLSVEGVLRADDIRTFSGYVRRYCGIQLLETLAVRSVIDLMHGGRLISVRPLVLDDIQMLLSFANLADVHIQCYGLRLTNADMSCIARAWPRLGRLRLHPSRMDLAERPACTLNSLLSFAEHCPRLEELQLVIDATAIVVPDKAGIPFPRAHESLRALNVMHSPIASGKQVASFLTRFFPSLDPGRLLSYSGNERMEARWTSVRQILPVLLDARIVGIHGGCKV